MLTDRQLAYEFAGLSLRNVEALVWVVEQGKPVRWWDITEHCPGYRPSFRTVLDPLLLRKLIRTADGGSRGMALYEATPAGAAYALRGLRAMLT